MIIFMHKITTTQRDELEFDRILHEYTKIT